MECLDSWVRVGDGGAIQLRGNRSRRAITEDASDALGRFCFGINEVACLRDVLRAND